MTLPCALRATAGDCSAVQAWRPIAAALPVCRGKSKVQQQMLVMRGLQEEVSQWHGFTMMTEVPDKP